MRPASRRARALGAAALGLLPGCAGPQSVLDPAGAQAGHVATLWWVMLGMTGIVWLGVVVMLTLALLRRRPADEDPHDEDGSRARGRAIGAGVAVTIVVITVVLAGSLVTDRATAKDTDGAALVIEVIGRQWWWDVYYRDPVPARHIRTSNEIHLPVGRPVELRVRSADVIHSLWIPNLHGKIDLLPGRTNILRLRADRLGLYRAQCAEFCGLQHAKMALVVVVESDDDFARWSERERRPASPAPDSLARAGHDVFMASSCALCHQVRGTIANASAGPDLTHLASRRTIAAGTLPNRRGNLAGWILDPQHIKPGSRMPATQLESDELHALLHYLESLE